MSSSESAKVAADEVAMQAEAKLSAYLKVVRMTGSVKCPPLFAMQGVEVLFAGRGLEELIRRPFVGRCAILEKGGPIEPSSK